MTTASTVGKSWCCWYMLKGSTFRDMQTQFIALLLMALALIGLAS